MHIALSPTAAWGKVDKSRLELIGSLKLGNVWFFVLLILGPPWPMDQLNKNPNIA